jgi:FMN phosphatase YigB (HAD superfamily)
MEIIKLPATIRGIVMDLDRTLYPRHEADPYLSDSAGRAMPFLGEQLEMSQEEVEQLADEHRQRWIIREGRRPVFPELLESLGIDPGTWYPVRAQCCRPESFITANLLLRDALQQAIALVGVAILTNAPCSIAQRVIQALGMANINLPVLGADEIGNYKPQREAFCKAARHLRIDSKDLVAIGDRRETDCDAAIQAGYGGAVRVKGPDDVITFIRTVLFQIPGSSP